MNGTLTIVTAPTTTTLATSTTSAQYGDPVTLTATVSPSGATGTVIFMQGAKVLGTGTVSGGVATLTTSTLPAGTYTITSSYQGDTDYGASTSGPVTLTISPRTAPGGGAALTVTVADASRPYGQGNPAFSYTRHGHTGERRYICHGSHRRARLLDHCHINVSGRDLSHIGRGSQLEQLCDRLRERHAHRGQGHAGAEWVGEYHADLFAEPIELWPIGHLHSNGPKRSHRHGAVRGRRDGAGHGSHQWHDSNLDHKYANSGNPSGDSGLQRRCEL